MEVAVNLSRAWVAWIRLEDFEHCLSIVPLNCWQHAYSVSNRGHRAVTDAHILAEVCSLNYIIVVLLSVIARPSHRAKNNWYMDQLGTFLQATVTDRHVCEPCGTDEDVSILFCLWLENSTQLTTVRNWRSFGSFSAVTMWIIDVSIVRRHISGNRVFPDGTKIKNHEFADTCSGSLHSPETQLTGTDVGNFLQYILRWARRRPNFYQEFAQDATLNPIKR